jgi:ribosomal protein S18 acetylase RimI-like enzyme
MRHDHTHHEAVPPATLREATAADAELMALVGRATFLETYAGILGAEDILAHCASQHAPEIYSAWLADSQSHCWIAQATHGAAPVGYLVLAPASVPIADPEPTDMEIKRIYLLHRFQRGGTGRKLMETARRHARNAGCLRLVLGVYSRNHQALAFYDRLGFRRIGERTFRVGNSDYFDYLLGLSL